MKDKCESTSGKKELNASIHLLLEGPELVLQEPTTCLTGAALKGLLTAQEAVQVGLIVLCTSL